MSFVPTGARTLFAGLVAPGFGLPVAPALNLVNGGAELLVGGFPLDVIPYRAIMLSVFVGVETLDRSCAVRVPVIPVFVSAELDFAPSSLLPVGALLPTELLTVFVRVELPRRSLLLAVLVVPASLLSFGPWLVLVDSGRPLALRF